MRLVVCPLLFSPDVTPASDAAMSRAASVSAPTTHGVNNQALVFHTDLFLAALAACWIAGQLPFLLARFSRAAEWRGWHTLRPARVRAWRAEPPAGVDGQVARRRSTAPPDRRPVPPPHVRSWSSRMVRFARFLQRPLDRGTSVGQACMLVGYFVVLLYPFFYRSNPFTDPLRAGYVALSQLPVAFALAMRNSPPGTLAGVSYEKLNFIHRFAGRMIIIAANIHALGYVYKWLLNGNFDMYAHKPANAWGFAALAWTDLLMVTSHPFFRQRAHNFFKVVHWISALLLLVSLNWHVPTLRPWLAACGIMYAFDLALRALKTRYCTATLAAPLGRAGPALIQIPALGAGWRAGQHVRVRVLARGMGRVRWAEAHPLTIAGAPGGAGMLLVCARAGAWSGALLRLACDAPAPTSEAGDKETADDGPVRVRVLVEGPYGGVGHTAPASFGGVVLFAGGAGLSFALALLADALCCAAGRGPAVVRLVWAVRGPTQAAPFLATLDAVLRAAPAGVDAAVVVRYTRALEDPDVRLRLPPRVLVEPGRPDVRAELADAARRTLDAAAEQGARPRGLVVGACGPGPMCEDVARAVAALDRETRDELGGVEYLRESFGL